MAKTMATSLSAVDPFAVKVARDSAAQFVTGVTDETRKAIRTVVVKSLAEGIPPKQAAQMIRSLIGLSTKQATAVANLRKNLMADGESGSTAMFKADKYASSLLGKRAEMIARTEIMRSLNIGQKASWDSAVDQGLIAPQSLKQWIVAPDDRLCPLCEPMDGAVVPLDQPFQTAMGKVDTPPMHPNCRCTLGLQPPSVAAGEAAAQAQAEAKAAAAAAQASAEAAAVAKAQAEAEAQQQALQEAQEAAQAALAAEKAAKVSALAANKEVGTAKWLDQMLAAGKIGPQAGSNPGGIYKDARGEQYYVKQYANPQQAMSEVVSNRIYSELGLGGPKSYVQQGSDGKTYFASKLITNEGTLQKLGMTAKDAKSILKGFSADVLTANWDAVGTGLDNVVRVGSKVVRIDQGGSLLFRAQGGLKPSSILTSLGEWESFVTKNAHYASVFQKAGLTHANQLGKQAIAQIDAIEKLRDSNGGWAKLVKLSVAKAGSVVPKSFINETVALLEARTTMLLQKRAELQTIISAPIPTVTKLANTGSTQWPIADNVTRQLGSNYPSVVENHYKMTLASLGSQQIASIKNYTGSSYHEVNNSLRVNPDYLGREAKAMQAAVESAPKPPPPELVWRGVRIDVAGKLGPGDVLTMNGFQSTSIKPSFASSWGEGQALLEIKPSRGLYISPISQHRHEQEFLLPHGAKYRVVGRKSVYIGGMPREVIQLEMLP